MKNRYFGDTLAAGVAAAGAWEVSRLHTRAAYSPPHFLAASRGSELNVNAVLGQDELVVRVRKLAVYGRRKEI